MKATNTKIIAAVIVLIVLLGLGGYLFLGKNKAPQTQTSSPTPTRGEKSATQSLLDLLSSGVTQKCTFASTNENATTKGTIYISDTKMRGDIKSTSTKDNKTTNFYMIRNGDTTYIWGDSIPGGIKMRLSAQDLQTNNQAVQYFNTKEKAQYSCGAWVIDNSVFNPPASVKFMDVSAIMPKTTGTTTQTRPGYSCAGITDPTAKAACEASLQQ